MSQCPFYEDSKEKLLSGLRAGKNCAPSKQQVLSNMYPLMLSSRLSAYRLKSWTCGPPQANLDAFMALLI